MFIGLLGIVIPGLPDIIFIFVGTLIYAIWTHFDKISGNLILIFAALTFFSYLFDYLGTALGAKKFGASRYGIIGAILGAFLGFILFSFIGLIFGAIFGTAIFEMIFARKEYNAALKAGYGAFLGLFLGMLGKIIIAIIMIGLFIRALL